MRQEITIVISKIMNPNYEEKVEGCSHLVRIFRVRDLILGQQNTAEIQMIGEIIGETFIKQPITEEEEIIVTDSLIREILEGNAIDSMFYCLSLADGKILAPGIGKIISDGKFEYTESLAYQALITLEDAIGWVKSNQSVKGLDSYVNKYGINDFLKKIDKINSEEADEIINRLWRIVKHDFDWKDEYEDI